MNVAARRREAVPLVRFTSPRLCPVCRSDRSTALHRQRYALFDDSDLPAETTIVECDDCGMVHAASGAQADDYCRHYARHSKYDTAVQVSGSGETPADARRLDELVGFLAQNVPSLADHGAAVLDVGAGRGGLLAAFLGQGYDRIIGIDPSPGCVEAMRAHGIAAEVGELEQSTWPTDPGRFDLVVLSHVLEHVFDVADVFDRVAQRVAAGGSIYIEVPDAARYTVERFPPFYFFDPEHINHFDAPMLGRLASRHGWEVAAPWSRVLDLGAGQSYPAVGVVLRRSNDSASIAPSSAAAAIERYVEASTVAAASSVDASKLEALIAARTPVVVWGAGSHAQRLLAQTGLARCAIAFLIDSDPGKQGRSLDGHRVVAPEDGLAHADAHGASIVVAIAVGSELVVDMIHRARPGIPVVRL